MIGIKGIVVSSIDITEFEKGQGGKMTANYDLMSTTDRVLAKQSINGYSDVKVSFSPATVAAVEALRIALKNDIEQTLGLVGG